jgi:hypothetical protein
MGSSFLRNRIINGAMQIDQRNNGASQTFTAAAAIAYNVDRFYASCTGANVAGQRAAGPSGFQYCYQFTGAASVTGILFGQRIESFNCADFVSQSVTLSANISNSLLTTVTWTAYYANSTDSFTSKTQIATGTFTVSSTATTYQATFNAGANAANGIAVEFTVGAQTSGTWKITGVQLEAGSVATPFERRQYGQELALCQRYLPAFLASGTNDHISTGLSASSTSAYSPYIYLVTPRVAPTGVTVSSASHFYVTNGSGGIITCTAVAFSSASLREALLQMTVASGLTSGQATLFAGQSTSAQLLFTGCEL